MAKLENKLGVDVKILDDGVDAKDIANLHKSIDQLKGTPTITALGSKLPPVHVVGNSFPKLGYKDYHVTPEKIIIWHPSGDKIPIQKKIHDSLSRLALSTIINKVGDKTPPALTPNANLQKPISGDQLSKRKTQSDLMKSQRRNILRNNLVSASKMMWDNKTHLPPAIKRRLVKKPKEGEISPQAVSLLHKMLGKRMLEKSGDTRLLLGKLNREAKTPELKNVYTSFSNVISKLIDHNWISKI